MSVEKSCNYAWEYYSKSTHHNTQKRVAFFAAGWGCYERKKDYKNSNTGERELNA